MKKPGNEQKKIDINSNKQENTEYSCIDIICWGQLAGRLEIPEQDIQGNTPESHMLEYSYLCNPFNE